MPRDLMVSRRRVRRSDARAAGSPASIGSIAWAARRPSARSPTAPERAPRRQDRRPRQRVGRVGEAAGLRRGRHRLIAGPSEVLIVADARQPAGSRRHLLAQAEHDPGARDPGHGRRARRRVQGAGRAPARDPPAQARSPPRHLRDIGAAVLVALDRRGDRARRPLSRRSTSLSPCRREPWAPHPQRRRDLPRRGTPEAVGDYVAGSNHVLPTAVRRASRRRSACTISSSARRSSNAGRSSLRCWGRRPSRLAKPKAWMPTRARSPSA